MVMIFCIILKLFWDFKVLAVCSLKCFTINNKEKVHDDDILCDWKRTRGRTTTTFAYDTNKSYFSTRARQSIKKGIKIACCYSKYSSTYTQRNMVHLKEMASKSSFQMLHAATAEGLWTIIIPPFVAKSKWQFNDSHLASFGFILKRLLYLNANR